MTDWHVAWSGSAQQANIVGNEARLFGPSLCPSVGQTTRYVRLDLNTTGWAGRPAIGGVILFGRAEVHQEWVSSPGGRIIYRPTPGVEILNYTAVHDAFSATVASCAGDEDAPSEIILPTLIRSSEDSGFFGDTLVYEASIGVPNRIDVSLAHVLAHLSAARGKPVLADDLTVNVASPQCFYLSSSPMAVPQLPTDSDDNTQPCNQYDSGAFLELNTSQNGTWSFFAMPMLHASEMSSITIRAYTANVSYTLRATIAVVCPPGANVYECAISEDVCQGVNKDLVWFNGITRRCQQIAKANDSKAIYIASALLALAAVAGAATFYWYRVCATCLLLT